MDGTEGKKDSLQPGAGQALTDEQGTSKTETKSYTETELNKAISDALAAKGRDAKTLSDREASLNARDEAIKAQEAEIDRIKKQRDEAELDDARHDPTKLTAYQARKAREKDQEDLKAEREALKKDRAALDRDKADHQAAIQAAQETQLEIDIWEIGGKHGINPVTLKDSMKRLNLSTVEQAEALAKELSGTTEKRPPEGETEFNPISGVTAGHKESSKGKSARQIYAENFRKEK